MLGGWISPSRKASWYSRSERGFALAPTGLAAQLTPARRHAFGLEGERWNGRREQRKDDDLEPPQGCESTCTGALRKWDGRARWICGAVGVPELDDDSFVAALNAE